MKIMRDHHEKMTKNINRLIKELNNLHESAVTLENIKSELKKYEEGMRCLATIIKDLSDAVIMVNLEGRILAWNRGAEKIYGWSEMEALDMNFSDILPGDKRGEVLTLVKRLKRGEMMGSFETQRLTKDQKVLDVWLTATLLKDEKDKPVVIATIERDITELNKEKEDLRQLKEHCEMEVERKTKELIEVKKRMNRNEKLVALGKLAGMIGHELKDPLNVIRLNIYLLHKSLMWLCSNVQTIPTEDGVYTSTYTQRQRVRSFVTKFRPKILLHCGTGLLLRLPFL